VPVLVNSRGAAPEMRRAVVMTDCAAVIADRERLAVMTSGEDLPLPVVLLGDGDDPPATPGAQLDFAPRALEDPALIMFSSGTTGHPKAIVHSQGGTGHAVTLGLLIDAAYEALYAREFGKDPFAGLGPEVPATVLSSPLFHVAGLLPYLRAIVKGAATILVGKWNADTVYDLLERNTVIRLGLVPTMIFDMLASPRVASGALSQLRFLSNGTAALAPQTAAAIREALPHCLLTNTYGQTETMERVASFGGREYEANLDAVGCVVPTTMLSVLREDGSQADPGELGEIAAYGANTMTGYHGDAEASAQTIRGGWVLSGDLGRFDKHGLLHIVDRKKNMVIAGGENIYCAEVERVMAEHPAVAEALAFGEPDARLGERLVAVAVLKPGQTVSEDELKAHCRAHLAIYKVPRAIGFTQAPLPRNATGKVAKGEFLQAYARPWAEEGELQT
jgi:long-chain acyl-CoA synthetase